MRWRNISSLGYKPRHGLAIALLGLVLISSCRVIQYVPIETGTSVHVKDSTAVHWIDSVRIHEATRYKDMAWLGDTLQIEGQRSRMWAYADTTKEALLGGLQEDKVEEKTRIIYKDKIEYRDSLVFKEIPVEVPVETVKKIYPKWMVILSILGILSTAVLVFQVYLKIKKKFPL